MRAMIQVKDPDEIEVTVSITMKVKDWKTVKARMEGASYPDWELRKIIDNLVGRVNSVIVEGVDSVD